MADPFPVSVEVITITGAEMLAGDGTPLNGVIILTPSVPVYVGGVALIEGSAALNVEDGVAVPIVVPCTDAVSPSFTYTITQRLAGPDSQNPPPVTGVTIPHSTGSTVDITTLLAQFG